MRSDPQPKNSMSTNNQYVVFCLDGRRFGLNHMSVKRIVHAAAVTPIPNSSDLVAGVITMQGDIVPVVNLRSSFGLPPRDIELDDLFVVVDVAGRTAAMIVDSVEGLVTAGKHEQCGTEISLPGAEFIHRVVRSGEQTIFIFNIERFLAPVNVNISDGALASD